MSEDFCTSKEMIFILCQCLWALTVQDDSTELGTIPLWPASGIWKIADTLQFLKCLTFMLRQRIQIHTCPCDIWGLIPLFWMVITSQAITLLTSQQALGEMSPVSSLPFSAWSSPQILYFSLMKLQGSLGLTFCHLTEMLSLLSQYCWNLSNNGCILNCQ